MREADDPERKLRSGNQAGFTLVEVSVTVLIVTIVLLAAAATFSSSLGSVNTAERITEGTFFVETVMEDLGVQTYDNLLAMNGNQFFDQGTAAESNFTADLTAFELEVDLLQVQVLLRDVSTGRELGRVTTLRSRN